jgi:uncharacterized membrane protein YraQ (UPF0718 family)
MTVGEAKFLDWVFVLLGAMLFFGGWRSIHKHRAQTDMGEYVGKRAVLLGWLWLIIGALLIIAVAFNIPILKSFGKLFMEASS